VIDPVLRIAVVVIVVRRGFMVGKSIRTVMLVGRNMFEFEGE